VCVFVISRHSHTLSLSHAHARPYTHYTHTHTGPGATIVSEGGVVTEYETPAIAKEEMVDTNGAGDAFVGVWSVYACVYIYAFMRV
jgi:sugar/nucleoside kinase (ribokinase family)